MALTVPQGLSVANRNPVDDRTIFQTLDLAKASLHTARRYLGLRFYVSTEKQEYWFRDGLTDDDIIPYRPGISIYPVRSIEERNQIPDTFRFEGLEANVMRTRTLDKYVLIGGIGNEHWVLFSAGGTTIDAVTFEATLVGDGQTKVFVVPHPLDSQYIDVSVFDSDGCMNMVEYTCISESQIRIDFAQPLPVDVVFRVVCRK